MTWRNIPLESLVRQGRANEYNECAVCVANEPSPAISIGMATYPVVYARGSENLLLS